MNYTQEKISEVFNVKAPENALVSVLKDKTNPYLQAPNNNYVFRNDVLREVLAFLKKNDGDGLYVFGPTGSGKSSVVTEITARLNRPTICFAGTGRTEFSDLVGHHALISTAPNQPPEMQFQYGPLPLAMKNGYVLLINEVDLIDPSELSGLNDVLQGLPLIINANGAEVIKPHSNFRVIVTGNSFGAGDDTGKYQGVVLQNIASMDRYRFTRCFYAEDKVEEMILLNKYPKLPESIRTNMVKMANHIRDLFMGEDSDGNGEIGITMSTRVLCRWASLTLAFKGADNSVKYALEHSLLNRANTTEKVVVNRLGKDIFGKDWLK